MALKMLLLKDVGILKLKLKLKIVFSYIVS